MRTFIAALLDCIPFDPRSRRALDETLLDWSHEAQTADSALRRFGVTARGLLSTMRAAVISSLGEIGRVPFGWIAMRLALFIGPPVALLVVAGGVIAVRGFDGRGIQLIAMLVPSLVLGVAPPAIVLALAWRVRRSSLPAVGSAIAVALTMLCLAAWALPLANQQYGTVMLRAVADIATAGSTAAPEVARPMPHLTIWPGRPMRLGEPIPKVTGTVIATLRATGFAVLSGAVVLLARSLVRRAPLSSALWLVAVPGAYFAVSALIWATAQIGRTQLHHDSAADGFGLWTLAGVVLVSAMAIWRDADPDNLAGSARPEHGRGEDPASI